MLNILHIYPVTHKVATTVTLILQISKPRYKEAKLLEIPTAKKMLPPFPDVAEHRAPPSSVWLWTSRVLDSRKLSRATSVTIKVSDVNNLQLRKTIPEHSSSQPWADFCLKRIHCSMGGAPEKWVDFWGHAHCWGHHISLPGALPYPQPPSMI